MATPAEQAREMGLQEFEFVVRVAATHRQPDGGEQLGRFLQREVAEGVKYHTPFTTLVALEATLREVDS